MATYKEIKGVTVQTLDADPVEFVGSWSSGGAMNTGRRAWRWNTGLQTAGLSAGGFFRLLMLEQYNGSSWTETHGFKRS